MDRNLAAQVREAQRQSTEALFKEALLPLVQAFTVIEKRVQWLETPWYKRLYLRLSHPIGLWFARRRAQRLEAKAKPAKEIAELQEPVIDSVSDPNPTN